MSASTRWIKVAMEVEVEARVRVDLGAGPSSDRLEPPDAPEAEVYEVWIHGAPIPVSLFDKDDIRFLEEAAIEAAQNGDA